MATKDLRKYIIVDSLARSGTTLLTSCLRSQENSAAFCPGFNEPLSGLEYGNNWTTIVNREFRSCEDAKVDLDDYKLRSLEYIDKFNQLYDLKIDDFKGAIYDGNCPDEILNNVSDLIGANIISSRWNQGICWFYKWTERPEHYWVTIIRNPMSRAYSSNKKHGRTFSQSINYTKSYFEKLEHIEKSNNPYIHILYYEDLVKSPAEELAKLYLKFNIEMPKIDTVNLLGSNCKPFIPQPAELNGKKVDGYYKGEKFSKFYTTKVDSYKDNMDDKTLNMFKKEFANNKFLKRYFT